MTKTKSIAALFIAAILLSALAATSASADSWFVNGAKLTGSEELTNTAKIDEKATLNVPGLSLKVTCAGLSGVGPKIVAGENAEAEHLKFEACSEVEPSTCKVKESKVETEPILALQALALFVGSKTQSVISILHPKKAGGNFAILELEGTCAIAGENPVKGLVKIADPTGTTELAAQLQEGLGSSEGNNSLEVDKQKGFIEKGKILLTLKSGNKWSFHS